MNFSEIISISGMSGLYRLVSSKSNGIIVTSLEDGKTSFISSRLHNVSALENIAIFRQNDENTPLREVFMKMEESEKAHAIPAPTVTHDVLKAYMLNILPDFDQERVHFSDLKKLVKWYSVLKAKDLLPKEEEVKEEGGKAEEKAEEAVVEEKVSEKKPAVKKAKKAAAKK